MKSFGKFMAVVAATTVGTLVADIIKIKYIEYKVKKTFDM